MRPLIRVAEPRYSGVMPGIFYGWPKNVIHHLGIEKCVFDINATLRPHFAIVDGIVGMEGDGPIMGDPRHAGVVVMSRNRAAADATAARARTGTNSRCPPEQLPCPPGSWTEWVASKTTGQSVSRITAKERMSETRLL